MKVVLFSLQSSKEYIIKILEKVINLIELLQTLSKKLSKQTKTRIEKTFVS